ncbi:MAG: hypothetical protein WCO68_06095 [Verrucomicrobiota bacterium]
MKPLLLAVFAAGVLLGGAGVFLLKPAPEGTPVREAAAPGASSSTNPSSSGDSFNTGLKGASESASSGEKGDFSTRLHQMLRMSPRKRYKALMTLTDGMTPAQVKQALGEVEKLKKAQDRSMALGQLLAKWAETDPKNALAYAQKLKPMERRAGIGSVVGAWAERDPAAAEQWVAQLPAGAEKNAASQSILV